MDFLKKYVVRIDFDQSKVTFIKGKKKFDLFSMFKPGENENPEWGESIPLKTKLFFDNVYFVEGSISEDIETDFLVDSGWYNPDGINNDVLQIVNSNSQKIKNKNEMSYVIVTLDNNRNLLERFSIGSLEYKNNIFLKNNFSILGLDFLSRHIVTFDFPNEIMYLKKGKNYDKQPDISIPISAIGCVINYKDYVVEKVDPNGLAYKKGIREGDTLIKIDGRDTLSFNVVEFFTFWGKLYSPEKFTIDLIFKRGEDTFTVIFTKQDSESNKD